MPITKLEDLKPDPRNANRGTPRGHSIIERSVRERGAGRSGLAAADGTMIAGSQTLQKMAELGMKIKPVHTSGDEWVVVIRDDIAPGSEEATLLAIEDNRATEVGLEWEPDVLAAIAREFDVSALFTADELAEVARPNLPEAGNGGDDFDPTPDDGPTRAQLGDLWIIGGVHRLIVGDCTDAAVVARLMGGERAALMLSDPPYNVGYDYDTIEDKMSREDYSRFCQAYLTLGMDVSNMQIVTPGKSNERLYDPRETMTWYKGFGLSRGHYYKAMVTEPILLFGIKPTNKFYATDHFDVHTERIEGLRDLHTCPKPIALFTELLEPMTERNEIVYDSFLGSGTTLIAAHRTGRRCYGCEISPRYADVILRRAEAEGLTVERADG